MRLIIYITKITCYIFYSDLKSHIAERRKSMTNTELLKEIIRSKGLKYNFIANELGITYMSLNKKINNVTEFTIPEVDKFCKVLDISTAQMRKVFFNHAGDY